MSEELLERIRRLEQKNRLWKRCTLALAAGLVVVLLFATGFGYYLYYQAKAQREALRTQREALREEAELQRMEERYRDYLEWTKEERERSKKARREMQEQIHELFKKLLNPQRGIPGQPGIEDLKKPPGLTSTARKLPEPQKGSGTFFGDRR
jgi:hypothetical protein